MAQERQAEAGVATLEHAPDDFAKLLQKEFKPNTDTKRARIEQAVQTLAQQALADAKVIPGDVFATVEGMISAIDRKLSEQVNQIIHHPEFQKLESAWRGLNYLVMNTSTGADLKIKVLNIGKDETLKMLKSYKGASWDQSPLFKKIYSDEFGKLGGQPFGAITCDYFFDHTGPDVEVLNGLAKIGAAAHAPFIAGTSPSMVGMERWTEIGNPRDLGKQFDSIEYMAWRSFRQSNDSRYVALTLPRFLGRPIYGAKTNPVDEFGFEEETEGQHDNHLWLNASYALATRITAAHKEYGWTTQIRGVESGGTVTNLPTAMFPTDDGGMDAKCPTEVSIDDRREAELSKSGFMALVHRKNTDQATFIGGQTAHLPKKYEDPDATASANLSARLPYIFASCRFGHYLKCMVRDWVGGSREAPQLERDLQSWVMQYVDLTPENSNERVKAEKPLKAASIKILPDESNPGYYRGVFRFVPHYQLEGMDVSLSMVSRLPKAQ
jgi:type VI secretion system protein ImpC